MLSYSPSRPILKESRRAMVALPMRRRLLRILAMLAVGYVCLLLILRIFESNLVFFPICQVDSVAIGIRQDPRSRRVGSPAPTAQNWTHGGFLTRKGNSPFSHFMATPEISPAAAMSINS